MKHYKKQLSLFVNHELAADIRQTVAAHLLQCAECRAEHDEIKLGAALAGNLRQTSAPVKLWHEIENSLGNKSEKTRIYPNFAFRERRGFAFAAVLLAIAALALAVYLGAARNGVPEIARSDAPAASPETPEQEIGYPPPDENASAQNQTTTANLPDEMPSAASPGTSPAADPELKTLPKHPFEQSTDTRRANGARPAAWDVETLAGMPRIGDAPASRRLAVGEILETDADSRARVRVANIGSVEVAPNSRLKLVNTRSTEHRLALEKGALKAQIFAPPRLFIVDTPSAAAIDLGCEYTLEVDAAGNSRLHVTSGIVALENGRDDAIVPAGAIALTKKGKGVGTPFAEDSSAALQDALYKFDFENGGPAALETIIRESRLYDSLSLWHLLARAAPPDREKVFDALAARVKPPAKVTRAGVLRLDRKMLDAWWTAIENVWFE